MVTVEGGVDKLNGLDLFSGIGGLSEGLQAYATPIAYCERDRFCQSVLLSRISSGQLPRAPIWDDITSLTGTMLPGIDIIYGGFPCQDISHAGTRKGLGGERSVLFYEVVRLSKETKPKFIFLENVPAIRTHGLDRVVWEFTELGYDCRWCTVSAAEVGGSHIRQRWFLLAHSNGLRLREKSRQEGKETISRKMEPYLLSGPGKPERTPKGFSKPRVRRTNDGDEFRRYRLRALGNSVVPLQAKKAFEILSGISSSALSRF